MNVNMPHRSLNQASVLSGVKLARRDRILAACEAQFAAHGFRATTIEALAEAAAISKVTMYSYFRDKDAVFAAVAERLTARLLDAVTLALGQKASMAERIAGALNAKHMMIFDLVRSSPFSSELFHAKSMHVDTVFKQLDANIIALLSQTLLEQNFRSHDPRELAQLMFAAANGIATGAHDKEQCTRHINQMVTAILKD